MLSRILRQLILVLLFATLVPMVAAGAVRWNAWSFPSPLARSPASSIAADVLAPTASPDLTRVVSPAILRDERFLNLLIGRENAVLSDGYAKLDRIAALGYELNRVRFILSRSSIGSGQLYALARSLKLEALRSRVQLSIDASASASYLQKEILTARQLSALAPGNPALPRYDQIISQEVRLGTAIGRPPVSQAIPGN